jgi:hypothetical protein
MASRRRGSAPSARTRSQTTTRRARSQSQAGRRGSPGRSAASAKRTRDHDEIRQWVEDRGGHPSVVKRTSRGKGSEAGVLRIDFPGFSGAGSLQEVSWDEWFQVFDDRNLEFLYQEKTANGKPSRFNKLVCP